MPAIFFDCSSNVPAYRMSAPSLKKMVRKWLCMDRGPRRYVCLARQPMYFCGYTSWTFELRLFRIKSLFISKCACAQLESTYILSSRDHQKHTYINITSLAEYCTNKSNNRSPVIVNDNASREAVWLVTL